MNWGRVLELFPFFNCSELEGVKMHLEFMG
jgi:hypothetical protein